MTYHKLSKQYHPDHLPSLPNQQDAHTTFTAIANAYELLMDHDKRREYDYQRSLHTDIINDVFNVDDEDSGNEEEKVFGKCDWCHIVDCNFPQLKPLKCTVDGCNKLVHHLCQIEFERREGFLETLPLKCCLHHPQSPLSASKLPPVNDPEDKLHSSSASNSKTSMADSSGHPIDAGKKAAAKAASSSSVLSSSSDDSSEDSSNDGGDGARSAQTIGRGKDLYFEQDLRKANRYTWGHLQQMNLLRIRVMIITKVHIQQQQQVVGKFYQAKSYTECYLQPKIGPPSP